MLEADGEADIAIRHAGGAKLVARELRVRGRCGMDRKAPRVADVGDMIEELQSVDETAPCVTPAFELEADETALTAFQIPAGPRAARRFAERDG